MTARTHDDETAANPRAAWMGTLAKARPAELEDRWARLCSDLTEIPDWQRLRGPETGMVMVRGRAGGDGSPFNLGEMTVTRCTVRLKDGAVGHAYVAGRDGRHAELAAAVDALMQNRQRAEAAMTAVVRPLAEAQATRRDLAARQANATKVEFFTLVRGED
ncbi:MAG: phosphonate C-P lyase system protein PhnG [Alphaproteobacteria bacterium]